VHADGPRHAFGVTAAARVHPAAFASALEGLGYDEAWANDTRGADGLAMLGAMASGSAALRLAVGVVPLSEWPPSEVAARVTATAIGADRLTVGVGSGASRSLALVRDGVAELRRLLPGHAVGVAAVGPRMSTLAAEVGDALIANWALPERLAELRSTLGDVASIAGRPRPRLVAYVRTAIGRGASARLRAEMDRYAGYGPHYAAALGSRSGVPVGVAVDSGEPDEVAAALAPYRAVADTVVVRALPAVDSDEGWMDVARAAMPTRGSG
jgi:alkanesulfonate monooxygenase SsuD/methylene tetrahydromethanopterin reductase-like flavin-dependent oxidoreductase (luciferase family)